MMKNQNEPHEKLLQEKSLPNNIFVDVDDTLVLYQKPGPNPRGYYWGTPWNPNLDLIRNIRKYVELNPHVIVHVWSGGGQKYAEEWVERLELNDVVSECHDKSLAILHSITENDIVIDDDPNIWKRTHTPSNWAV